MRLSARPGFTPLVIARPADLGHLHHVPLFKTASDRDRLRLDGAAVTLAIMTLINVLNYADRMTLAAVLEPVKQELHLRDGQLGLLSGLAFAMLYASLGIAFARLADRGFRVQLLSGCVAWWSVATSLTGAAANFGQLFMARAGVGIGEAGCVPAAHSMIGDLLPGARRAFGISVLNAGAMAGSGFGLLATATLAGRFGWRSALVAVGLAGIPLALVTALFLRDPHRQDSATPAREKAGAAISVLLKRPALVHLTIALSVGGFANFGIAQWLPSFYARSFGLPVATIGLWLGAVVGAGGIAGVLLGGIIGATLIRRDQRWELWLPAFAYGGAAPLYAWTFVSKGAPMALTANFAAAVVGSSGIGVGLSAIQTFAEPHRRATAVALTMFLSSLIGFGLGPWTIGLVSDALQQSNAQRSLADALLTCCLALIWAAVHFLLAARACADRLVGERFENRSDQAVQLTA